MLDKGIQLMFYGKYLIKKKAFFKCTDIMIFNLERERPILYFWNNTMAISSETVEHKGE